MTGLIEGTRYAYRGVSDLLPDERLQLLEEAHNDGWEPVLRGVQVCPITGKKGEQIGEDYEEFWYFRRVSP